MRSYLRLTLLSLAALCGCSSTVVVPVPPRMDLKSYGTLGIIEFSSNAGPAVNAQATRRFQEQVQAAQPGTPFIELGTREAALAAAGSGKLDAEALRKIGAKHGLAAIFVGEIVYSEPKAEIRLKDLTALEGGVRAEMRGDISSRLVDTRTGASVWSSSAWARRQIGRLNVSAEHGVSGAMSKSDPREEMVPALVYQLTHDFRPGSVRQAAK
jgi:hypothetical protein